MGGCESTTTYYYDRCGAFGCFCLTKIITKHYGVWGLGDGECLEGEYTHDVYDARQDCYVHDYFYIHLWILVSAVGVAGLTHTLKPKYPFGQLFLILFLGVICTCSLVLIAAGATAAQSTINNISEQGTGRASFRYKDPIKAMFYMGWILTGLAGLGALRYYFGKDEAHSGPLDQPHNSPSISTRIVSHDYNPEFSASHAQSLAIETQPRPTSHHIPLSTFESGLDYETHERIHHTTLNPDFLSGDQNPSHHDERSQGALHTHHSRAPELHHNEAPSSQNPHQGHMHNQSDISSLHDQQEQRNADGELPPVCTESETFASDCNNETHEEGELPPTYTDAPTTGSTNIELSELPDLTVVNWLDSQFDPTTHHQTRHHRGDSSA